MFQILVACTNTGGIGKSGGIPWNIPEDMQQFASLTREQVVIMGRGTWESLPNKPLPKRTNIVVTKDVRISDKYPSVITCQSLQHALDEAKKSTPHCNVFVIGGEGLYREAIIHQDCEKVLLTKVHNTIPCDRFFPMSLLHQNFIREKTSEMRFSNTYIYQFCDYKRRYD